MDESVKILSIRAELPVTSRYVYLNAGTNGPLPTRTVDAMIASARDELSEGRIRPAALTQAFELIRDVRAALAEVLYCDPLDVALTQNTTEGVNIALMGIDWRPGDEIITATTEHPGVLHPVYQLHQRFGVRVRMTEIGKPGVDALATLRQALTPRTRAVALSHASWSTGVVLTLPELADAAHRAGALFICDAAQAIGMTPSRVLELGVDAYACSGQKWLCGPNGAGGLFVRRDRLSDIQPTFMGYISIRPGMSDYDGNYVPAEGALRYMTAALNPINTAAFLTSLRWMIDDVTLPWAYERIATLGHLCHDRLTRIDGVHVLTPREQMAGLVHFSIDGVSTADAVKALHEREILIRDIPSWGVLRASLGFYNTVEEIERLAESVQALAGVA